MKEKNDIAWLVFLILFSSFCMQSFAYLIEGPLGRVVEGHSEYDHLLIAILCLGFIYLGEK